MPHLWLDADVLIQAKNQWYGFDFAPGFWKFLDEKVSDGIIRSSVMVYAELTEDYDDELAEWAKDRKDTPLWVPTDQNVQTTASAIINWVNDNFEPARSAKFLNGADPWLIAHAKVDNGIVVTHEAPAGANTKTPKIPNIAQVFGLEVWNVVRLLRELNAKL